MAILIPKIKGYIICDHCGSMQPYQVEQGEYLENIQKKIVENLPQCSSKTKAWKEFEWEIYENGEVMCCKCLFDITEEEFKNIETEI